MTDEKVVGDEDKERKAIEKVFEKIKRGEVKMTPCCFFVARSWFWLTLSSALFFIGAVIFSIVIRYIDLAEPMVMLLEKPIFFLLILPHFLIVLGILVLVFSALAYRKSRSFCRHENWTLMGVLFFGAILIGASLYEAKLEEGLAREIEKSPRINSLVQTPIEFWNRPSKGTLSGLVTKAYDGDSLELKSRDGSFWKVVFESNRWEPVRKDAFIKIIGRKEGDSKFVVKKVFKCQQSCFLFTSSQYHQNSQKKNPDCDTEEYCLNQGESGSLEVEDRN